MNYNKCVECKERSIEPNCHTYCEQYLAFLEKTKEIREQRQKEYDIIDYFAKRK